MAASDLPISELMTSSVHAVDLETSLPQARKLMSAHGIRHLPVLDNGKVVGLLSERDLGKLEGFPMIDFNIVSVPDAMSDDPYVVSPSTPALEVLQTMRDRRYGSAIIAEDRRPVGIFTTHDAVQALVDVLSTS